MFPVLIKNATVVNEGVSFVSDVLVKGGRIEKIGEGIEYQGNCREIDATGLDQYWPRLLDEIESLFDVQIGEEPPSLRVRGSYSTNNHSRKTQHKKRHRSAGKV